MRKRTHVIDTARGTITVEETDDHITIGTEPLITKNVSVFLHTAWRDSDTAVSVNGQWLDGAHAAGQWQHVPEGTSKEAYEHGKS